MKMNVDDILEILQNNGCENVETIKNDIAADSSGDLSLCFASFISNLCQKISQMIGTEENVNNVSSNEDLDNWKLELASFLRELQCPYDNLMVGDLVQRLEQVNDRILLIEFLARGPCPAYTSIL